MRRINETVGQVSGSSGGGDPRPPQGRPGLPPFADILRAGIFAIACGQLPASGRGSGSPFGVACRRGGVSSGVNARAILADAMTSPA